MSSSLEKLLQGGGEESGYIEVATKEAGSLNIKDYCSLRKTR